MSSVKRSVLSIGFTAAMTSVVAVVITAFVFAAALDVRAYTDGGDFLYTAIDDTHAAIDGYTGSDTEVDIPPEIDGYTISKISANAFASHTDITKVTIPEGVTEIGGYAFNGCTSLTSITIPASVTTMDNVIEDTISPIFTGCSGLTTAGPIGEVEYSINFGWTDTIPADAFSSCNSLTNVVIPEGVTEIDKSAFEGCTSLTNVTIPASVTTIGYGIFSNCTSLTTAGPIGEIEYSINFGWTDTIPANAFYSCDSLVSIVIPDSVKEIGDSAFRCCRSLPSVTIP